MLGRLRMTLGECEDAYLKLSKRIFQPKRGRFNKPMQIVDFLNADGKFDSKVLEDAIKEVIRGRGVDEDVLLKDPESACKVYAAILTALAISYCEKALLLCGSRLTLSVSQTAAVFVEAMIL